jgi:hypothetical protein
MGNGWLDDVAAPTRRWALAVPLVIGTFCLCAVETYERGTFDPVGVPYQAALMAALLFVPVVVLSRLVRTKLCWALTVGVLSVAPVIGLVRTVQSAGAGFDAFRPFLVTVLVLGIGAAVLAVCAEVVLRPDDHPLARRLAREVVGSSKATGASQHFWRAED